MKPIYDFGEIVSLERVRAARLCVLGCGAIGCNVVLAALQMGWSRFTLVDFDKISAHNCARSGGIFLPGRDVGKSKVRLLAGYIRDWDPDCEAVPLEVDVRDLGGRFFRGFDCVVCALDNMESVWHAGEILADSGIPLYRGATNGWNSSVEIVENRPGRACLCCGKDPSDSRDLRVTSCGERYLSDIGRDRVPALQVSSALCANRLVAAMTRNLGLSLEERPDIRYYDTGRELMIFDLIRDSKCDCHGIPPEPDILPGNVFQTTLNQFISMLDKKIGQGSAVYGTDDYIQEGVCRRCGARYPVGRPLRRVRESEMRCGRCPRCPITERKADDAVSMSVFTAESPVRERTLFDLGFRICGSILVADADGHVSAWTLSGDWDCLMKKNM